MKPYRFLLILTIFVLASLTAWSQPKDVLTISGGYVFANIEDYDTSATGWRINLLYESNPKGAPLAHGAAIGFMSLSATGPEPLTGGQKAEYTVSTLPIYYAPKYMFGADKFKAFLKGAVGIQMSWLSRTGGVAEISSNDFGFYGGAGAGVMLMLGEEMFVNAEYEWAYLSNSYYKDGFLNSVMAGIGFRL
jgi:opacity protein-like surface antigen